MIRLTLLLVAGLFATLQIAGKDTGQMRIGLIEGQQEAAALAAVRTASEYQETIADAQPVEVAFAPTPRVIAPTPVTLVTAAVQTPDAATLQDVRYVTGRSVNVRGGPSTAEGVVAKLTRGEAVNVVWIEDNGWARIRVEGDGIDGYMSADFLTQTAP